MISVNDYLSVHAKAVKFRSQRAQILASNVVNADTPGFKPSDISFKSVLNNSLSKSQNSVPVTNERHIPVGNSNSNATSFYRAVDHNTLDKNSVDSEYERAQFTDNAIRYQVSLQFLNSKISGLIRAIRGE